LIDDPNVPAEKKKVYREATFGNSCLDKFKIRHHIRRIMVNKDRGSVQTNMLDEMNQIRETIKAWSVILWISMIGMKQINIINPCLEQHWQDLKIVVQVVKKIRKEY
jgi:hypothetical protein